MQGLMLHCGGRSATYDEVCAITPPESTQTWHPLAYGDALGFIKERLELERWQVDSERYGLNKRGSQLFAVLTARREDWAEGSNTVAFGFRGSIDKSLSEAVVSGSRVFICDNLAFNGSSFRKARKNTLNVWDDVKEMVIDAVDRLDENFQVTQKMLDDLRERPCSRDDGYKALGLCRGHEWITSSQANRAMREWKDSRFDHEDFKGGHALALYNAVTDGLKVGGPGAAMVRHTKIGKFFERVAATGEFRA